MAPVLTQLLRVRARSSGVVATGETRAEAEANIRGALKLHLEGLTYGDPIPQGRSTAEYVEL